MRKPSDDFACYNNAKSIYAHEKISKRTKAPPIDICPSPNYIQEYIEMVRNIVEKNPNSPRKNP